MGLEKEREKIEEREREKWSHWVSTENHSEQETQASINNDRRHSPADQGRAHCWIMHKRHGKLGHKGWHAAITIAGSCWMDPIIEFLAEDRIPDDESETNKIRRVALQYWLSANRNLYRRSFGGPYLLCLHPRKVDELLVELHEGVCGDHAGRRSLAH